MLVDETDAQIGTAGKFECHAGPGRLHRAFTALVFDPAGRLLLTRRSASKMLWPGAWDATFASHPRQSESYAEAAVRRMPDELGAVCEMEYLLKFLYRVRYSAAGSENEVCGLLAGTLADPASLSPAASEISEVAWQTAGQAAGAVRKRPESYCPWMLAALWLLGEAGGEGRCAGAIAPWTETPVREALAGALEEHMGRDQWRQVP